MLRAWHETQLLFTGSASSVRLAPAMVAPRGNQPRRHLIRSGRSRPRTYPSHRWPAISTWPATSPSPVRDRPTRTDRRRVDQRPPADRSLRHSGSRISTVRSWVPATINLSDANPASIPACPQAADRLHRFGKACRCVQRDRARISWPASPLCSPESGVVTGSNAVLQTRQARHTRGGLHLSDKQPLRIYALDGNMSGLTLFSAKKPASLPVGISPMLRSTSRTSRQRISRWSRPVATSPSPMLPARCGLNQSPTATLSRPARPARRRHPDLRPGNAAGHCWPRSGPWHRPPILTAPAPGSPPSAISATPISRPRGADLLVAAGIGPAASLGTSSLAFDAFIESSWIRPRAASYLDGDRARRGLRKQSPRNRPARHRGVLSDPARYRPGLQ